MDQITPLLAKSSGNAVMYIAVAIGAMIWMLATFFSLPERVTSLEGTVDGLSSKINRMDCIMVSEAKGEPIRQCL